MGGHKFLRIRILAKIKIRARRNTYRMVQIGGVDTAHFASGAIEPLRTVACRAGFQPSLIFGIKQKSALGEIRP